MEGAQIESIITSAEWWNKERSELIQYAEITIRISKDFDWKAGGPTLLKKLQAAAELIGRGS